MKFYNILYNDFMHFFTKFITHFLKKEFHAVNYLKFYEVKEISLFLCLCLKIHTSLHKERNDNPISFTRVTEFRAEEPGSWGHTEYF